MRDLNWFQVGGSILYILAGIEYWRRGDPQWPQLAAIVVCYAVANFIYATLH